MSINPAPQSSQAPAYDPSHYVNYQDMVALLQGWAAMYPHLCTLESVGQTLQGRDLWLMTLTNSETGPHYEKPAYWIDGNTHASEVAGCQAALHTIHHLLAHHGKDRKVTEFLAEQTFYILPRISPDGAELFIEKGEYVRSSLDLWPSQEEELMGLEPKDLDGNGLILKMRAPDPRGMWKKSKKDPRVMLLRAPDDEDPEETYYNVFTEGTFNRFDGFHKHFPNKYGIDLNRQYPMGWHPEGEQMGAGPYALSQPESRAVVKAICDRPNIVGLQSYHTFSAVILRPYLSRPDSSMDKRDLQVYEEFAKRGEEITGYEALGNFCEMEYAKTIAKGGDFPDWAYEHRGIFAFTNEIWHIAKQSGLEVPNAIDWFINHMAEEDEVHILKWCDETLEKGSYYQDWAAYDHPQLGAVEIGGMIPHYTWSNPPRELLEAEVEKNMHFTFSCAAANPRVHIQSAEDDCLGKTEAGEPIRKLTLVLENKGYLPTQGSERAIKAGVVKKPTLKLTLASNVTLKSGMLEEDLDHLAGRVSFAPIKIFFAHSGRENHHQKRFEWVVVGDGTVDVTVAFERAGTVRHRFG